MEVKKNSKRMKMQNEEDELKISDELENVPPNDVPSEPSHNKVATRNVILMLIVGGILCAITYVNLKPGAPKPNTTRPDSPKPGLPKPNPPKLNPSKPNFSKPIFLSPKLRPKNFGFYYYKWQQ